MPDFLKLKMHQIQFLLELRPRSRWGSLQPSPDPLAGGEGARFCQPHPQIQPPIGPSGLDSDPGRTTFGNFPAPAATMNTCGHLYTNIAYRTVNTVYTEYKSVVTRSHSLTQGFF